MKLNLPDIPHLHILNCLLGLLFTSSDYIQTDTVIQCNAVTGLDLASGPPGYGKSNEDTEPARQVCLAKLVGAKIELRDPVGLAQGFSAGDEAFTGMEAGYDVDDLACREWEV